MDGLQTFLKSEAQFSGVRAYDAFEVLKTCGLKIGTAAADHAALLSFYHSTGGPDWKKSKGWSQDTLPSNRWHGVEVDARGRVVAIELPQNGLVGELRPRSLHVLTKLKRFDLRGNPGLSGGIPPSLVEMRLLSELKLDGKGEFSTNLTMPFTGMTIADYGLDSNRRTHENVASLCVCLSYVPLRPFKFDNHSLGITWNVQGVESLRSC